MIKKTTFLLLTALVLFAGLSNARALLPPEYLENDNYTARGSVARLVVKTYKAIDKGDKVETGDLIENPVVVEFLETGQIDKLTEFNRQGVLNFCYISEYDQQGVLLNQKLYSEKGTIDAFGVYEYVKGKTKLPLAEAVTNAKGEPMYKELYAYDKAGFLVEITRNNGQGDRVQKRSFINNEKGLSLAETIYNRSGEVIYKIEKSYDSENRISIYNNISKDGILTSKGVYGYNDKGDMNRVRQTSPGMAINIMHLEYEYDVHGNWTKRTVFTNDYFPQQIIVRKIEYR